MFDLNTSQVSSTVPVPKLIADFVSTNPRAAANLLNNAADAADASGSNTNSSSAAPVPPQITDALNASSSASSNPSPSDLAKKLATVGEALNRKAAPDDPDASANADKDSLGSPNATAPVTSPANTIPSAIVDMTAAAKKPSVIPSQSVAATSTADTPSVPPLLSSFMGKPDLSQIGDLTSDDMSAASTPELKEPLLNKVKDHVPGILKVLGIVGGGLEAAGEGPAGHLEGAKLFEQSLENQENRALTARQLDIAQQKADTDEGYRRAMMGQYSTVPVQVPDPSDPSKTITVQVQQKDAGKYAGAQATAGARERSTTETNETKMAIARLKQQAESGQFKQLVPGLNPDSGQYEMQKIDKNGNSLGWVPNSVVSSLVSKTSDSVEWKQQADGSYVALPKQTVSGPLTGQPNARVVSNTAPNANGGRSTTHTAPTTPRRFIQPTSPIGGGSNAQNSVIGFDPDGQQVFTSASDASKYGLTQVRKVGQAEAEKVTNARSLMPIFNNNSPSDPGIVQLIDKLDKSGDLGVVASRWNEFLAGKFGAGNPLIEDLRTKMGLAETGLMQVHVGARGSAALMEHFHDLVNSGHMNADTMKSGIVTEFNYIKSKAMLPKPLPARNAAPANNAQPNTNPYGFVPAIN